MASLPPWKLDLLAACTKAKCLSFGSFTLNLFYNHAYLVRTLSTAFARTIADCDQPVLQFDVLFGPAYKGIPLAAVTFDKLAEVDGDRFGQVGCAFNRKEVKSYGDGGSIVGASLKGKRVLIIDDVITAGTAINESVEIINKEGGQVAGIVVALDRMEKMPSANDDDGYPRPSAIGEVRRKYGIPVLAVLTLNDIIDGLKAIGNAEDMQRMEDYRSRFRASD
ncbi:MAG: hypothetical protein Q9159_006459 [Coniocarpon cinnabarinum]